MNKKLISIVILLIIIFPIKVKAFQLEVNYNQEIYTIEAESSDVVEAVKNKLEPATSINSNQMILKSGETILNNNRTLADYNIGPEENQIKTINMTLKKAVTALKYTITEPVEGETPDLTANIEILYENQKLEFKDVIIDWLIINGDTSEILDSPETHKFIDKKGYKITISEESNNKLEEELNKIGYTITNDTEKYINDIITTPEADFVIHGIKSINIQTPIIYIGKTLPIKVKAIITTVKGTQEVELDITGWTNNTSLQNYLPNNVLAQENVRYSYIYSLPNEIITQIDRTTKILIDGKLVEDLNNNSILPIKLNNNETINPETSDHIQIYIITLVISLIGLITLTCTKKLRA